MSDTSEQSKGIFSLPNELFLRILDLLDVKSIVTLTPICRQIHCLALRVLHHRLQVATDLNGYEFYLECHPPAARLTAGKMFCKTLGAHGLDELAEELYAGEKYVGQVKKAFSLYSRFRPQHHEPAVGRMRWNVPGDIPGSRTHPSSNPAAPVPKPEDRVAQTVHIDASDLFCQLQTVAFLGKRHFGLLASIQDVSQGYIRVWREWLSKQCESKSWSDGESIAVHREVPTSPTASGRSRADSVTGVVDPHKDPSVLWLNTRDENVCIKFRVKERKWRRDAPVLFASELDLPVSYVVEFEEVLVRTTRLVEVLEEFDRQMDDHSGKAVIFASFRG